MSNVLKFPARRFDIAAGNMRKVLAAILTSIAMCAGAAAESYPEQTATIRVDYAAMAPAWGCPSLQASNQLWLLAARAPTQANIDHVVLFIKNNSCRKFEVGEEILIPEQPIVNNEPHQKRICVQPNSTTTCFWVPLRVVKPNSPTSSEYFRRKCESTGVC